MNVSVFGLGKLGLPLAICLAKGGNRVIGVDKNLELLNSLRRGEIRSFETDSEFYFNKYKDNFIGFTDNYRFALSQTETSIIIVNSQLGNEGYSSQIIETCVTEIARELIHLKKKQNLILSSTILPGTCVRIIKILEDFGLVQNIDFTFAYIPDFIKLGSALIDFQNPDFVLIGSRDSENALPGRYLWNSFVHSDTVCREVSVLEAEIVKICLNAYLVSKINFANFVNLALFNESGVNPRRILEIVGLDKRIGQSFLLPGTPYGGTCFPRDATAFQFWAKQLGLDAKHIAFSEAFNKDFEDFFVRELSKFKNVAILGFSFKEGTNVLTGSPSLKIAEQLVMKEVSLRIFDRFYNSYPRDILDKYFFCESVEDATKNVEAVLIMHNDPRLHPSADCQASIFDPWHITRSNF